MNKTKVLSLILVLLLLIPIAPSVTHAQSTELSVNGEQPSEATVDLSTELNLTWNGTEDVNVKVTAQEIAKSITITLTPAESEKIIYLNYSSTPGVNTNETVAPLTFLLNQPVTFLIEVRDAATNALLEGYVVKMASYAPVLTADKYVKVGTTGPINIKLTDEDLNDNAGLSDSFGAPVFAGQPLRVSMGQGVFEVLVNGQTAIANKTGYLIFSEDEENEGNFTLSFDLSLIQATLKAGDVITFRWTDYYSGKVAEATTQVVTEVPMQVTLDRAVYPMPNDARFNVTVQVSDPATVDLDKFWLAVIRWDGSAKINLTSDKNITYSSSDGGKVYTLKFTIDLSSVSGIAVYNFTGATIKAFYNGTSATATIQPSTATLTINATSVSMGDVVAITLVEPDANLDSTINDTEHVYLGTTSIPLTETGPTTGVFVGTITVDNSLVSPDTLPKTFTITYTDNYSGMTSVNVARPVTRSVSFTVQAHTAQVFFGDVNGNQISSTGPYSLIYVCFKDPDYIFNSTLNFPSGQEIYIRSTTGDEEKISTLMQSTTDKSMFCTSIKISLAGDTVKPNNGTLEVTVPDTVIMRAVDPASASGGPATFLVYLAVRAWDGTIRVEPAKPFYVDNDDVWIYVEDPDANIDSSTLDPVEVTITTSSDPIGTKLTLVETGPATGVFKAPYLISKSNYPPFLKDGDKIYITYYDKLSSSGKPLAVTKELQFGFITATPIKPGAPAAVKFLDIMGNEVAPKVGQPTLIQIPVSNADTTRSVTTDVIIVFYDANNVPVGLAYGRITLGAGASGTAIVGWLPNLAGTFTAKVFFWDLANKVPLSEQPLLLTVTVQ